MFSRFLSGARTTTRQLSTGLGSCLVVSFRLGRARTTTGPTTFYQLHRRWTQRSSEHWNIECVETRRFVRQSVGLAGWLHWVFYQPTPSVSADPDRYRQANRCRLAATLVSRCHRSLWVRSGLGTWIFRLSRCSKLLTERSTWRRPDNCPGSTGASGGELRKPSRSSSVPCSVRSDAHCY